MAKEQNKTCAISIAQNPPVKRRQLSLPLALDRNQQKPQISSIPETSPKQRNRYRVMLGDVVLGDFLTIDQAINLAAKGGAS